MHELVFFSIIILIIIRLIGVIVSIEFYYESKSKTYVYFFFGWNSWVISLVFYIFIGIELSPDLVDFFLLINYISGPIAMLFILTGLASYYLEIKHYMVLGTLLSLLLFPLIIFFTLGLNFVYYINRILTFSSYLNFFLLPIFKFKDFKKKIGKSIRWYFLSCISIIYYIPLSIILSIIDESYGLYSSEKIDIIILSYIPIILTTILLIAFMIHVEYNISFGQKRDLKDMYSHDLGNILQIIESSYHLIKENEKLDDEKKIEIRNIIEKNFKNAGDLLKEIRDL
ncbi:MAG: hypothetical protein JXA99_08955 [Candidatus Lokiarchaeota archaeon]|nr:hypothetical protein [Candidatus Lokiarchaeota archaeon]